MIGRLGMESQGSSCDFEGRREDRRGAVAGTVRVRRTGSTAWDYSKAEPMMGRLAVAVGTWLALALIAAGHWLRICPGYMMGR